MSIEIVKLSLIQQLAQAIAERDRLQEILDSRPAINAGLPETYIEWSRSIYRSELRLRGPLTDCDMK